MAPFYEFFENILGFFDIQFAFIFLEMYDAGGYNQMGLLLIIIPLIVLSIFYFFWNSPYMRLWNWLVVVGIITISVAGSTYGSIRPILADFILDQNLEVSEFAKSLVVKYAFLNGFLSILVSFLWSLLLKQFSKIQTHLPF